jgi:hypothetical protein
VWKSVPGGRFANLETAFNQIDEFAITALMTAPISIKN